MAGGQTVAFEEIVELLTDVSRMIQRIRSKYPNKEVQSMTGVLSCRVGSMKNRIEQGATCLPAIDLLLEALRHPEWFSQEAHAGEASCFAKWHKAVRSCTRTAHNEGRR